MTEARILVIDTFHTDRESPVSTLLQAVGHNVQVIPPHSLDTALASDQTDLIIIYHTPPELDGLNLTRTIQQSNSIPTVLIAAQPDTEFLLGAMRAGAADCLTIPTDQQDLLSAINRIQNDHNRAIANIHHMFDQAGDAFIAIDEQDRLLFLNTTTQDLLTIPGALPTPGVPLKDTIENPILCDFITQPMVDTTVKRSEIHLEASQKTLSIHVTPIPGYGRLAVLQDITHLKELDRIKSEFVERVSRDIRSPLTTIQGYVELIERMGPINDQQKQFINRISFAVHSITALLSDLLELGRIEAGFEADREPTHFAMVLRYALEGAQQALAQKNLRVEVNLPEETSTVMGNPLRLRQMIDNLIENAIKFTPQEGSIRITLSVQDTFLVFQVTDSGIGIPPEDQPHVFDKFYRASNARERFKGAGLGLSIVKGIVDKHNGRIWLESQVGVGTQFTVMLPIQSGQTETVL